MLPSAPAYYTIDMLLLGLFLQTPETQSSSMISLIFLMKTKKSIYILWEKGKNSDKNFVFFAFLALKIAAKAAWREKIKKIYT